MRLLRLHTITWTYLRRKRVQNDRGDVIKTERERMREKERTLKEDEDGVETRK